MISIKDVEENMKRLRLKITSVKQQNLPTKKNPITLNTKGRQANSSNLKDPNEKKREFEKIMKNKLSNYLIKVFSDNFNEFDLPYHLLINGFEFHYRNSYNTRNGDNICYYYCRSYHSQTEVCKMSAKINSNTYEIKFTKKHKHLEICQKRMIKRYDLYPTEIMEIIYQEISNPKHLVSEIVNNVQMKWIELSKKCNIMPCPNQQIIKKLIIKQKSIKITESTFDPLINKYTLDGQQLLWGYLQIPAVVVICDWNPYFINCDYELALLQAIQKIFPNTQIIGCFFHLKQAIRRKASKIGLIKDPKIKQIIYELGCLGKISPSKLIDHFDYLLKKYPEDRYKKLFRYFYKTYLKRIHPEFWNHSFIKTEKKTTSSLENYNRQITEKIGRHKSLNTIIKAIQKEEEKQRKKLLDQLQTFIINKKKNQELFRKFEQNKKKTFLERYSKFKKDLHIFDKQINNYIFSNKIIKETVKTSKISSKNNGYNEYFKNRKYNPKNKDHKLLKQFNKFNKKFFNIYIGTDENHQKNKKKTKKTIKKDINTNNNKQKKNGYRFYFKI
ncbi:hypothetical protein M0813_24093 [Anaeramoeba flamelloides]|uniref:MULE transposase domain-containing protein n=1 Tax=Anaeramoeba flamelloides TaxID=1746091 RepID=A0ABQ8Y6X8_9EUKA|nr:hypothetical protein M0813_24093 [Anaeramoeba flamelloides]